jgi:replication factor A1
MEPSVKENVLKINSLNPYAPNPRLFARVSEKSEIRHWSTSSKTDGKLFQATLEDETGQVRAVWFNAEVDRDFSRLHVGQSYEFSKFFVKMANRKFSTIDNDYEITVGPSATILEITDSSVREALQGLTLSTEKGTNIADILAGPPSDAVNVLGIVLKIGESVSIQTKASTIYKREIYIVDHTEKPISVVLWAQLASNFSAEPRSVIAISRLRSVDINPTRSLASTSATQIAMQPELDKLEQGQMLQTWFESQTEDSWKILTQLANSIR